MRTRAVFFSQHFSEVELTIDRLRASHIFERSFHFQSPVNFFYSSYDYEIKTSNVVYIQGNTLEKKSGSYDEQKN